MKREQVFYKYIVMKIVQNNIESILNLHSIIPVVTINDMNEILPKVNSILDKNINCIEVTLRTNIAFEAIEFIKKNYGNKICLGVGTVINIEQIHRAMKIGVDFIVSPGISEELTKELINSNIPFIPGIATPSDIILGLGMGLRLFKFFPANLFGGIPALKSYQFVFPNVKFCPTGGIDKDSYLEYLELDNVLSVGGSWMMK